MSRQKVVLYNPQAVFYTMPLALVAVGSALDPARYDVRIVDGRWNKIRSRPCWPRLTMRSAWA